MKSFDEFLEIFNELITNPSALKVFSELQKQVLDSDGNNIFHYLVFSENLQLIRKVVEFLKENDLQSFKKLITEKNRFTETPRDWALSIKNYKLRESISSLLENKDKEPPRAYWDRFYQSVPTSGFSFMNPINFINTKNNLDLPEYSISEKHKGGYIGSIYGKNLLKISLKRIFMPCEILYSFSEQLGNVLLRGEIIEPRFKRAYLHLYHFFSEGLFTVDEAKDKLAEMGEDVSNVNVIIKRLSDANLILKISREKETERKNEKNTMGRPKSLYRLANFFSTDEECPKTVEDRLKENPSSINHYFTPIKALARWIINEVTENEYYLVISSILEVYSKSFGNVEFIHALAIYDYPKRHKKRGRKKEYAEIHLWIKSISNFSQTVFRKLIERQIYITDKQILSLIVEIFQERSRILGTAMSYELKGLLARLISDRLFNLSEEASAPSKNKSLNLIVPFVDSDMTFLSVLAYLRKIGVEVNLYINLENSDLSLLLKKLFDSVNVQMTDFFHVKDLKYLPNKRNVFLINIPHEQIGKVEAKIVIDSMNELKNETSLALMTFPRLRENELISLYRERYISYDRFIGKIEKILEKNQLNGLAMSGLNSFIKLKDSSPSGSQINYGILILDKNRELKNTVYFAEEIENYTFRLSWLRDTLKSGSFGFILEYPEEYLDKGSRLAWIV